MTILPETSPLLPILRSIAREVHERIESIRSAEKRRESFLASRRVHAADLANVDAELAIHRRELRATEKELARLGCSLDVTDPRRILVEQTGQAFTFDLEQDGASSTEQPMPAQTSP